MMTFKVHAGLGLKRMGTVDIDFDSVGPSEYSDLIVRSLQRAGFLPRAYRVPELGIIDAEFGYAIFDGIDPDKATLLLTLEV